jgi:hypothetical protein
MPYDIDQENWDKLSPKDKEKIKKSYNKKLAYDIKKKKEIDITVKEYHRQNVTKNDKTD